MADALGDGSVDVDLSSSPRRISACSQAYKLSKPPIDRAIYVDAVFLFVLC